ncbi:hypothetical protein [Acidisoma sp. 7E03]
MQYRTPWEVDPPPEEGTTSVPEPLPAPAKRRGRRPAAPVVKDLDRRAGQGTWLYHHLTITGPAERVADFADAARGPGIVPWRLDGARIEEDIFHLAVSQPKATRSLSLEGCRILARQFRERAEARAARAAALVAQSEIDPGEGHAGGGAVHSGQASAVEAHEGQAFGEPASAGRTHAGRAHAGRTCPFDLHRLLPVPPEILAHEPTHPRAQAWLRRHWGLSETPRHVVLRPDARPGRRLPTGHRVLGYGFFTGGETPHEAITRIAAAWPDLRFQLQPRP